MKKLILPLLICFTICISNSGCNYDSNGGDDKNEDKTVYTGLLAEEDGIFLIQRETYDFGVESAKLDTIVKTGDCIVTVGTWKDNGGFEYTIEESDDALGQLIPQGAATSTVELWVEGSLIKTFDQM